MNTAERRRRMLTLIQESMSPVRGSDLASEFGVSRQIVVQDIAVLRAEGAPIVATPRGYTTHAAETPHLLRAVLAVRHGPELTEAELMGLVQVGVRVVDVIIDHPLYGELRGWLDLSTEEEVQEWLRMRSELGATLLSSLTGGIHLHTVESADVRALARARSVLRRLGISID